jgi:hypothetical protein
MVFLFLCEDYGASIDHAKITEVVNDVTVLDRQSKIATPARKDELFRAPEIMKTGSESRSEMVSEDQTITRVGADTLFSFEPIERTINLREGSILFQSPTGRGGGTINTASATASVLGTTIIVVATRDGGFKLLVLEGTGQVRMPNGRRLVLHGGQMSVVPPGARMPGPVLNFLLRDQVKTSLLVQGFKRPLPSWDKIRKQILEQDEEIAAGGFQQPVLIVGNVPNPNTRINQVQALHVNLPPPTPPPARAPAPAPLPTPPPPRMVRTPPPD